VPETQTGTTRITEVGVVMLPVTDQDRALDFYVGTLGLEKRSDVPFGNGDRWIEIAPANGQTRIALVTPREGDSAGGDARIAFATPDIEADHADLKARGVDVDAEIMAMGGPVPPMFWFRDPDGNSLLIVEQRA
jgi:catechol 2,3-dioxygenase-like lactoylglutathione lyase family enzyme